MQNFYNFINSICPLSEAAQIALSHKMVQKTYPKNHILVPDLSKCDRLYFIEKGLVRIYYHNQEREITDFFAAENGVFGPIFRSKPIKDFIHSVELLEPSTILSINIFELENLYQAHHDLERLGRLIALHTIFMLQQRIDSLQFASAKERYDDFLENFPTILQRAPLGHIASYLGMNQVTLSRARKQKH